MVAPCLKNSASFIISSCPLHHRREYLHSSIRPLRRHCGNSAIKHPVRNPTRDNFPKLNDCPSGGLPLRLREICSRFGKKRQARERTMSDQQIGWKGVVTSGAEDPNESLSIKRWDEVEKSQSQI